MNSIVTSEPILFDPQTVGPEIDFGTPASISTEMVSLEIDGYTVTVPRGTSIMRAAKELGITIPKLCASDNLEPFGSCRLCVVEIEGRRGTPASCTTPVESGLKVTTQNGKLAKLRKGVMELYISDHPLDCLTCSANGDCELQDMAGVVGLLADEGGFLASSLVVPIEEVSSFGRDAVVVARRESVIPAKEAPGMASIVARHQSLLGTRV